MRMSANWPLGIAARQHAADEKRQQEIENQQQAAVVLQPAVVQ
jgi:hypothetical protein